jgi:hypothetical protein
MNLKKTYGLLLQDHTHPFRITAWDELCSMNGKVARPTEFLSRQTKTAQLPQLLEQGRKISFTNFTTLKEIRNEGVTEGRKCI